MVCQVVDLRLKVRVLAEFSRGYGIIRLTMPPERPRHHRPRPEQTDTSRRSPESVGRLGAGYRRSEAEYQRIHESYERSLERTHTSVRNLPPPEDRYLEDMTEQDIDAAVSQMEKESELFHSQKQPRP